MMYRRAIPDQEERMDYTEFVAGKLRAQPPTAAGLATLPDWPLFPWQRAITDLALTRGRAAIFADTGTGKTRMELAWAHAVSEAAGKPVLLLAPLAVGKQTVREAQAIGAGSEVRYLATADDVLASDRVVVTNYERLHHFEPLRPILGGIVLDESSILKALDGKTRRALTDFAQTIPYRLCATATPAPNDYIELGQHAEFLGVLTAKEMMALYFTQDGNSTQKWRLKGHARESFWRWCASWATAMRRPSDVGFPGGDPLYDLPPLNVHQVEVEAESPHATGTLFKMEARTLQERREARKATLAERVAAAVRLIEAEPDEQWLVWCDLNDESHALAKVITGAVEVKGADSVEHKEASLLGFADGEIRALVTKPSIAGHGMNFQRCARVVFVGLSDSFERYYQAIRRTWRFGQDRPVECYVVTADVEGAVVRNIQEKQRKAEAMQDELVRAMADRTAEHLAARGQYETDEASGDGWRMLLGDCVERLGEVEDESVGLSVFSPPFPTMYVYTDQARDMGNVRDVREMIAHYEFLLPELMRVLMPGRTVAVHLAQAQSRKVDGLEIGLIDFRGETIAAMTRAGFTFYGEVTIDKNPQVKAVRTKDRGLLFKSLAEDSANMRMAQADYLLQFRKPGENPHPIRDGISEKYDNEHGWITPEEWIEWAAPVWYRASEHYPGGIRETDVLNVSAARDEKDERHLCPLQLGVIERAVKLWSAPGEMVLSPFAGVGSEGFRALQLGRRFTGVELKRSYFDTACRNLMAAAASRDTLALDVGA
jgi:DNA modification methylase